MSHEISTLRRFLYLNIYAFLLLFMGMGIALISIFYVRWWLLIAQGIGIILCFNGAAKIFKSWSDKKRKYTILRERNEFEFRPQTFKEFMEAPCGRLLVKIVLKDMNMQERYKDLKKM